MRQGITYRPARREAAKQHCRETGISFAQFWPASAYRQLAPTKTRTVRIPIGKYIPHQGQREIARRLSR